MRSRTTPTELAQAMAANPSLRLKRAPKGQKSPSSTSRPGSAIAPRKASVSPSQPTVRAVRRDYKAELVRILTFRGIQVEPEFKIFENRRFKADWRVVGYKILIEFEGGLFHAGKQGHSSVAGILRDMEKYNLCALAGWTVIRVCPKHIDSGQALVWIERGIENDASIR